MHVKTRFFREEKIRGSVNILADPEGSAEFVAVNKLYRINWHIKYYVNKGYHCI